ncbi:MAG: hypothetical protein AB7P14_23175 [Blastocatellales bacterium]
MRKQSLSRKITASFILKQGIPINSISVSKVFCQISLIVQVLCFSACDIQPVSIDRISRASKTLVDSLNKAKTSSQELTDSIGQAHKDLSQYLNANNLSDDTIKQFENKKSALIAKLNNLRGCESNIKFNSSQLFLLLKKRTEENTTPYLKEGCGSFRTTPSGHFTNLRCPPFAFPVGFIFNGGTGGFPPA